MSAKIYVERMIEELSALGVYDPKTLERLAILIIAPQGPFEIGRKERVFTEKVFGQRVDSIIKDGVASFPRLARQGPSASGDILKCEVKRFLGYGNMGPVFEVALGGQPFALKMYSSHEIQDMISIHGKFGLAGLLQDLESEDQPTFLSKLGEKVLSKKPKGIYARSKKIVKVHYVGLDADYIYILMDMLAVDTMNRVDIKHLGASTSDVVFWAIDCAVGLCHLHVEERRLHLNVRPEAFVIKDSRGQERLPKFSFFHFPKQFLRSHAVPSLEREFVLVDHLDTSVDVSDRAAKGLGTVGSWLFVPPEVIMQLLKSLREDYAQRVQEKRMDDLPCTIKLKRSQMDDVWALGLTLYQFVSEGKLPFRDPKSLTDMINAILLSKFDFSHIEPSTRNLIEAMLQKDPAIRFQKLFEGCPEKIKTRKVMAEAILYKLELLALEGQN